MSGQKRHSLRISERPVVAVDMFCGVGGLTYGLREAGLQVTAGYDLDDSCSFAYEANNDGATFLHADITTVTADDLAAHYPPGAIRVLVGCAPCQPYSTAAAKTKIGKSAEELQREWAPLQAFLDLILTLKPEVVSMENVVRLATKGKFPIYAEFKASLERAGYEVSEYRVFGPDYGIPQARRRLVLFASRWGKVALPPATHARKEMATVGEALRDLPRLDAGGTDPHDPLHKTYKLTERNRKRAEASKPGGTWADWPDDLKLACHLKASGATYGSVYGRMDPEQPAPTMTTQFYNIGTGRFVHPTQDRGLSLREGAILQTFPRSYQFVRPGEAASFARHGRQIGNAVPPELGRVIGRAILDHLKKVRTAPPLISPV
ncbi:DNA cytosine methyltransferase [Deinococcus sedimenti]|uniref:DNA cytosine methyltransferase n=1 Tax=Deinococcus sedimenti TaxID=1867090 RepID=UPI00166990CE|nr:DNA cytosine methyltransferase [Deinococcus sedimenti]